MKLAQRTLRIIFGLLLCGFGSYLSIQANIGLAPWEAFHLGVAQTIGGSYGNVAVATGVVILGVDLLLREKIGLGTILNTVLIGKFVDLFLWLDLLPMLHSFWGGVALMLLGQFSVSLGTYFYIGAGLGGGPRDSLMVALGRRLPGVPIGLVRGCIEGTVLLTGWLLGAKVGVGTVIAVFGISFILQATFRLLRFDVKAVRHESILETLRLRSSAPPAPAEQERENPS